MAEKVSKMDIHTNDFYKTLIISIATSIIVGFVLSISFSIARMFLRGDSGEPWTHYIYYFLLCVMPIIFFVCTQCILVYRSLKINRDYIKKFAKFYISVSLIVFLIIKFYGYPKFLSIYGYLLNPLLPETTYMQPIDRSRLMSIPKLRFGVYEVGVSTPERSTDFSLPHIRMTVHDQQKVVLEFISDNSGALDIYNNSGRTFWAFKYLHVPTSPKQSELSVLGRIAPNIKTESLYLYVKPTRGYVQ